MPATRAEPLIERSDPELGAYTDRAMAPLDGLELGPDLPEISAAGNTMLDCDTCGPPPRSAD